MLSTEERNVICTSSSNSLVLAPCQVGSRADATGFDVAIRFEETWHRRSKRQLLYVVQLFASESLIKVSTDIMGQGPLSQRVIQQIFDSISTIRGPIN